MWIDQKRGYFQDWITQQWVKRTGRRVDLKELSWLDGPIGKTDKIADTFLNDLCEKENLTLSENGTNFGLLESMDDLKIDTNQYHRLLPSIINFYENTANYSFDFWSKWCGIFRPFGWLLQIIFSKRLQQLNLPLNSMDGAQGLQSKIMKLFDKSGACKYTIWYRILGVNEHVIYSGVYTHVFLESLEKECLKVIFPLPNGNATVIMKTKVYDDGSLDLISEGRRFGDPGFYFLVKGNNGRIWAKYVKAMHENIHVYEDRTAVLHADHILKIWGATFLKLHYKMTPKIAFATSTLR